MHVMYNIIGILFFLSGFAHEGSFYYFGISHSGRFFGFPGRRGASCSSSTGMMALSSPATYFFNEYNASVLTKASFYFKTLKTLSNHTSCPKRRPCH